MMALAHRVLIALHIRGFHPAVLAGLIMMPAVVAVGFWTGEGIETPELPVISELRGSLDETPSPVPRGQGRNEPMPAALPLQ